MNESFKNDVQRRNNLRAESIVDKLLEWNGLITNEWTGFWMDPKGELFHVNEHIGWARRHVLKTARPEGLVDAGLHAHERGVYAQMSRLGWLKVTIEFGKIMVDPTRAMKNQMAALQELAIERQMKVVDSQTGRELYDPRKD